MHMSVGAKERVCAMSATAADIFAPFPAKRLARAADAHEKTAARWRAGETTPSFEAVIGMMSDDELLAALLRAAGREDLAKRMKAAEGLAAALKAFEL